MQITKTYSNGVARAFDVISVNATDDEDTVIVDTLGDGQLIVCKHDNMQMWQQLHALGVLPA